MQTHSYTEWMLSILGSSLPVLFYCITLLLARSRSSDKDLIATSGEVNSKSERASLEIEKAKTEIANLKIQIVNTDIQNQYNDIQKNLASIDTVVKIGAITRLNVFAASTIAPGINISLNAKYPYFASVVSQLSRLLYLDKDKAVNSAAGDALAELMSFTDSTGEDQKFLIAALIYQVATANLEARDSFIKAFSEWSIVVADDDSLLQEVSLADHSRSELLGDIYRVLAYTVPFSFNPNMSVSIVHSLINWGEVLDNEGQIVSPGLFRLHRNKVKAQSTLSEGTPSRESGKTLLERLELAGHQLIQTRDVLVHALQSLKAPSDLPANFQSVTQNPRGESQLETFSGLDDQWQRQPSISLRNCFLSGAILHGASLQGVDFRGAQLNAAILTEAKLQRTTFAHADLTQADLSLANMESANMYRCKLVNANMSRTYMHGAILVNANVSDAGLGEANLKDADLFNANFTDAILVGANLEGANLRRTTLDKARLEFAHVEGANFEDARMRGTELFGLYIRENDEAGHKSTIMPVRVLNEAVFVTEYKTDSGLEVGTEALDRTEKLKSWLKKQQYEKTE